MLECERRRRIDVGGIPAWGVALLSIFSFGLLVCVTGMVCKFLSIRYRRRGLRQAAPAQQIPLIPVPPQAPPLIPGLVPPQPPLPPMNQPPPGHPQVFVIPPRPVPPNPPILPIPVAPPLPPNLLPPAVVNIGGGQRLQAQLLQGIIRINRARNAQAIQPIPQAPPLPINLLPPAIPRPIQRPLVHNPRLPPPIPARNVMPWPQMFRGQPLPPFNMVLRNRQGAGQPQGGGGQGQGGGQAGPAVPVAPGGQMGQQPAPVAQAAVGQGGNVGQAGGGGRGGGGRGAAGRGGVGGAKPRWR